MMPTPERAPGLGAAQRWLPKVCPSNKKSVPANTRTLFCSRPALRLAPEAFRLKTLGRDDWIRTSGLVVPNDARYRAALHPEEGV
jgi:hypothetical protein